MDITGITPSTRPHQAINNAEALVAMRPGIKTAAEVAQWQQLADRELAQLTRFAEEGEVRLQNPTENLRTAQNADEHSRAVAEVDHIKNLLDQLDAATGKLSAARRQPAHQTTVPTMMAAEPQHVSAVATVSNAPRKQSVSSTATIVIISALVLLVVAGIALSGRAAPATMQISQPAVATRQTVTYAEIESNNKALTGVQWRNYTVQTQGKYADKWVGWVTDVSDSGGYSVHLNMEGPDSYTLSKVSFDTDKVSATKLGKKQQVVFSGQIESIRDLLGVQISLVNVTMAPALAASAQSAGASTSGPVYIGEESPTTICDNMHNMTSSQWMDYSAKLKGKRVDRWTGWVIDVKNNFTEVDSVIVAVSGSYSAFADKQTVITIPHEQALTLKKQQQIEISGTLLGAMDVSGFCGIAFSEAHLIPSN